MDQGPQTVQDDPYDVDVESAASLLGVGKTRLSQLTSRGMLSFQRRKIGSRNRLFYRRSELMAYLGRHYPSPASLHRSGATVEPPLPTEVPEEPLTLAAREMSRPLKKGSARLPIRSSARDVAKERTEAQERSRIQESLAELLTLCQALSLRLAALERDVRPLQRRAAPALPHAKPQPKALPEKPRPSKKRPPLLEPAQRRASRPDSVAKATIKKEKNSRRPTSTLPAGPSLKRHRKEKQ